MSLTLTSTISPVLTVSSRWFLEMKSYTTRMGRSFDSPELKNTPGHQKHTSSRFKNTHSTLSYTLRSCAYRAFCWGREGVHLAEV